MQTYDTRMSGTNLGTVRSAKQWRVSFAGLPNSRVMALWMVLYARRIAVVTSPRFRRSAAQRFRGQRRSKMNPRGRYYIRLIPIHSSGQENDVRRHKGWLPVCRQNRPWEGWRRERAGRRSALQGYRVNAPWMNDEPWGRPYPSPQPLPPLAPIATPVDSSPPANSNRISSRCLVRSVELRLESS